MVMPVTAGDDEPIHALSDPMHEEAPANRGQHDIAGTRFTTIDPFDFEERSRPDRGQHAGTHSPQAEAPAEVQRLRGEFAADIRTHGA